MNIIQLMEIFPALTINEAEKVHPPLRQAMTEGKINTPLRIAAFIAQTGHETAHFKTFVEYATGRQYENRKDLGNVIPGDGKRYKGRGAIMLTGRDNYRAAGQALGIDLEHCPERAANLDICFRVAVWFWNSRNLNKCADESDFDTITRRINGGYNGKASRDALYRKARQVLRIDE